MKYAQLGSISSGTMRDVDLLATFAAELDILAKGAVDASFDIDWDDLKRYFQLCRDASDAIEVLNATEVLDDTGAEHASEVVSELIDALDEFAPPCSYFGANEGDGADYGFWPQDIDEHVAEGNLIKLDELPDMVAVVNDHGNVTLYTIRATEVWSVV